MFLLSISFKIGTLFLKTILFSLLHFLILFSCKWLQLFFKREKQVSSGYICFMLNLCCVLVAKFDSNLSQKQALETFFHFKDSVLYQTYPIFFLTIKSVSEKPARFRPIGCIHIEPPPQELETLGEAILNLLGQTDLPITLETSHYLFINVTCELSTRPNNPHLILYTVFCFTCLTSRYCSAGSLTKVNNAYWASEYGIL